MGSWAPIASAAEITAGLNLTKSVADETLSPGQTTTYFLRAGCSSGMALCENAVLLDNVPDPLVVEDVRVSGNGGTGALVSTSGDGNRNITVSFHTLHENGSSGLPDGDATTVQVKVRLPQEVSAELNGTSLVNTAAITADNAAPETASVPVTLDIPTSVSAAVTKKWSQRNVLEGSGAANNVVLSNIKNTSNVGASTLTLVEPSGGTAPFESIGLTGFGAVDFPAGADSVQVNAVVNGVKVFGTPGTTAALPEGVRAADVQGLEIVFSSTSSTATQGGILPNGAPGSVTLTTALLPGSKPGTVANEVSISAQTPKGTSAPATSSDSFMVTPVSYSVEATKSFEMDSIVKGGTSKVSRAARTSPTSR